MIKRDEQMSEYRVEISRGVGTAVGASFNESRRGWVGGSRRREKKMCLKALYEIYQ